MNKTDNFTVFFFSILFSFEAYYAKAKANKEAGRLHEAVNDLTEALR